MVTPISSISLTFFVNAFLLLCSLNKGYAVGEDEITKGYLHIIKVKSLLPSTACNQTFKVSNSLSLELVHRSGPCIQILNQEKAANAPSNMEILLRDRHRVDSIHARLSSHGVFQEKQATLPAQSGASIGSGDYVVTVGLGTPKKEFTLIFDTGSDLTWTQCEPCAKTCYKQKEPMLDPTKSTSYKNISCSSAFCKLLDTEGGESCSSPTCLYQVQYGDGSYSIGFFATETLTLSSSNVFKNFLFGCGQQNSGLFRGAAGLLGLGRTKLSLPSQTAQKYKKLFSYCLPASSSSKGYLSFGGQVSKTVKFTPLSEDFKSTPFYGLDITELSVGGNKLSIDASIFSTSGTVIDSGTVITRLPSTAYSALSSAFRKLMTDYPSTDGYSIFDTCYDFSKNETIKIPKVGVSFKGGVEMDIDVSGILYPVNGLKKVCLAFAGNGDDVQAAIFGNTQQKTYQVVYDDAKGRVGFAPSGCN
ncbi:aspartyl protease family protein At5g10770-like [Populus nigra]|uniref:aspartyl protease family protein At5g10770-like n=1 Tax=Populus nigra TaxID=3691 RepID=UPI002B2734B5|nr:aspartyl protease family protein At5g10770-like [Populus nigra]